MTFIHTQLYSCLHNYTHSYTITPMPIHLHSFTHKYIVKNVLNYIIIPQIFTLHFVLSFWTIASFSVSSLFVFWNFAFPTGLIASVVTMHCLFASHTYFTNCTLRRSICPRLLLCPGKTKRVIEIYQWHSICSRLLLCPGKEVGSQKYYTGEIYQWHSICSIKTPVVSS